MVVRVRAGTTVAELASVLARSGQMVPLDASLTGPGHGGRGAGGRAERAAAAALRAGAGHGPRGPLRVLGRTGDQGGRTGRQERQRLRSLPPARRVPRNPGPDRRGGAALPPGPGPVFVVPGRGGTDPFGLATRLYRPSTILWDGTETWVLLEGDPDDVDDQASTVLGAAAPSSPVLPALGATRLSLTAAELRQLARSSASSWWAEVGVGTVHTDDPSWWRRPPAWPGRRR